MHVEPTLSSEKVSLWGSEGELVSIRVSVEPRDLEDLLETLAELPFPVNPQICHRPPRDTLVEFPAYTGRLADVRKALGRRGFDTQTIQVSAMLAEIRSMA